MIGEYLYRSDFLFKIDKNEENNACIFCEIYFSLQVFFNLIYMCSRVKARIAYNKISIALVRIRARIHMCLLFRTERKHTCVALPLCALFLQRFGYASSQTYFCVLALSSPRRKGKEHELQPRKREQNL
jgi:hypothetical protein